MAKAESLRDLVQIIIPACHISSFLFPAFSTLRPKCTVLRKSLDYFAIFCYIVAMKRYIFDQVLKDLKKKMVFITGPRQEEHIKGINLVRAGDWLANLDA